MSGIEEDLLPNERIIYQTNPHWIVLTGPGFLGTTGIIIASPYAFNQEATINLLLGLILVGTALMELMRAYLSYTTSEYILTNKRVIIRKGIVLKRSQEIILSKVESLNVSEPIIGRLLDYGTITIHGTGLGRLKFGLVAKANEFKRKVVQATQHN